MFKVLAIAALILVVGVFVMRALPKTAAKFPVTGRQGVWLWQIPTVSDNTNTQAKFKRLKSDGFNLVYLDITGYLDIIEQLDSAKRELELSQFNQQLENFLKLAQADNFAVEALAGSSNWIDPAKSYQSLTILQFVSDYNQDHALKFAGLQFDIEPYLSENEANRPQALTDYLATVKLIVAKYQQLDNLQANFRLGFVMPFWFSKSNADIYPAFALSEYLQPLPQAYLAVLDYRNYTDGNDGTIANLKPLFDHLDNNNSPVQVVIGFETGDVQPAKTTFHGLSKGELKWVAGETVAAYKNDPHLAGIAIHSWDDYLNL